MLRPQQTDASRHDPSSLSRLHQSRAEGLSSHEFDYGSYRRHWPCHRRAEEHRSAHHSKRQVRRNKMPEGKELHDGRFLKILWDDPSRIIGINWKETTA